MSILNIIKEALSKIQRSPSNNEAYYKDLEKQLIKLEECNTEEDCACMEKVIIDKISLIEDKGLILNIIQAYHQSISDSDYDNVLAQFEEAKESINNFAALENWSRNQLKIIDPLRKEHEEIEAYSQHGRAPDEKQSDLEGHEHDRHVQHQRRVQHRSPSVTTSLDARQPSSEDLIPKQQVQVEKSSVLQLFKAALFTTPLFKAPTLILSEVLKNQYPANFKNFFWTNVVNSKPNASVVNTEAGVTPKNPTSQDNSRLNHKEPPEQNVNQVKDAPVLPPVSTPIDGSKVNNLETWDDSRSHHSNDDELLDNRNFCNPVVPLPVKPPSLLPKIITLGFFSTITMGGVVAASMLGFISNPLLSIIVGAVLGITLLLGLSVYGYHRYQSHQKSVSFFGDSNLKDVSEKHSTSLNLN